MRESAEVAEATVVNKDAWLHALYGSPDQVWVEEEMITEPVLDVSSLLYETLCSRKSESSGSIHDDACKCNRPHGEENSPNLLEQISENSIPSEYSRMSSLSALESPPLFSSLFKTSWSAISRLLFPRLQQFFSGSVGKIATWSNEKSSTVSRNTSSQSVERRSSMTDASVGKQKGFICSHHVVRSQPACHTVPASLSMASSTWLGMKRNVHDGKKDIYTRARVIENKEDQNLYQDNMQRLGMRRYLRNEISGAGYEPYEGNSLNFEDVTEVHDLRAFGLIRSKNFVAFRHQQACGTVYSVKQHEESKHDMVDLMTNFHRLQMAVKQTTASAHVNNKSWPYKILRSVFGKTSIMNLLSAASEADATNVGKLFNQLFGGSIEGKTFIAALTNNVIECRAVIPYSLRHLYDLPTVPTEKVPPFEALEHLDREGSDILLPVDAPSFFEATVCAPGMGPPSENNQPWRLPLYKAFATLCFFSLHMYHIGERYFDFAGKRVDEVFPRPWRVAYVGSLAIKEWVPFWSPSGKLNHEAKEVLRKYDLRLKKMGFFSSSSNVRIRPGPRTPLESEGVLQPFNADQWFKDGTYSRTYESVFFLKLQRRERGDEELHRSEEHMQCTSKKFKYHSRHKCSQHNNDRSSETDFPGNPQKNGAAHPLQVQQMRQADIIWVFKGTDSVKVWTANCMISLVKDDTFSSKSRVHHGFSTLFHQALRRPLTRFLREAAREAATRCSKHPYTVVFTGHSLGGSLAMLASWFVAKNLKHFVDSGQLILYTVAFGAPAIGDREAFQEIQSFKIILYRLRSDVDPVPLFAQTDEVAELYTAPEKDIVLHLKDMYAIKLRRSDNSLEFDGRIWSIHGVKQLKGNFANSIAVANSLSVALNPLATHLHFLPCALSIMTGTYTQNGWSSFCVSPLLRKWPLLPVVLSPEAELEVKRLHEKVLPKILKNLNQQS